MLQYILSSHPEVVELRGVCRWYSDVNIVSVKRLDDADKSDIQAWLDSLK